MEINRDSRSKNRGASPCTVRVRRRQEWRPKSGHPKGGRLALGKGIRDSGNTGFPEKVCRNVDYFRDKDK